MRHTAFQICRASHWDPDKLAGACGERGRLYFIAFSHIIGMTLAVNPLEDSICHQRRSFIIDRLYAFLSSTVCMFPSTGN